MGHERAQEPVWYFHDPNPEGVLAEYLIEFFAELAAERDTNSAEAANPP